MLLQHAVHDQDKSTITSKADVICNQTKCDLVGGIRVVYQLLVTLCKDCGSYSNMENDSVKQLYIHCVRCANAMLDYQHEQSKWVACITQMNDLYYSYPALLNKLGVVEMELFKDDDAFETLLSRLQSCLCSSPNIDPGPMIDFYRKRHTYSKCKELSLLLLLLKWIPDRVKWAVCLKLIITTVFQASTHSQASTHVPNYKGQCYSHAELKCMQIISPISTHAGRNSENAYGHFPRKLR